MCGIVGFFSYGSEAQRVDPAELVAVRDHMMKRGPDGTGVWFSSDEHVALAHRRLEIIGLGEQGAQPMALVDGCAGRSGSIVVTFNGEIYNYESIRSSLEARGHKFRSTSDTEVLLHLYEDYGPSMVDHLRGMYAFIIWDETKQELFLVRDPYGIKPLYFADDGQTLRVASQERALLASGAISTTTNDAALAGLLVLGNIPEPLTAWSEIRSVPAGSTMTIDSSGRRRVKQFFSLAASFRDAASSPVPSSVDATVRESMLDTMRNHLVADVEVGLFLSAGIDSCSLLGLATEAHGSMHAITIGFDEFVGQTSDEVPLAKLMAKTYGARHSVDVVTRAQFESWLPLMFGDMDQPSIDGMNTWMASRSAANAGLKVVLSGLGGDEILGGYNSFTSIPTWSRRLRIPASIPGLGLTTRILLHHLLRQQSRPKITSLVEYGDSLTHVWLLHRGITMPWEIAAIIGKDRAVAALDDLGLESILANALDVDPGTDLGRVATLEGTLYMRNQLLRDADWAGMAHSVEIRVPLVDPVLLRAIGPFLLRSWGPGDGKRAISRCPVPSLPPAVSERDKTGFTVPMAEWSTNLPAYESWRRVKSLKHDHCPWARRWAYAVAEQFEMI